MPELKITSSDADAIKALAKLQGQINKLQAELAEATTKAKQASQGMTDGMQKAGTETEKTGKKVKDAGEAHKRAFGDDAARSLKNYVTGMLSVSAVIGTATAALRAYHEERKRGAESIRGAAAAQGELAQLAGGDPAKLQRMMDEVRRTREETGMGAAEAARLQFTLEGMGLADKREFFSRFRGIVGDPNALAEAAVTLQTAFGAGETGGVENIVSKLFAGAGASKTDVSGLATALTQFAQPARAIGTTDEEAIALQSVLTNALKSPEVAGTQLKALATTMGRRGVGGRGLLGGMEGMQALMDQTVRELPAGAVAEEEIQKLFGSDEALSAFRAIQQNLPQILEITRSVRGEDRPDLARRIQESRMGVPSLAASMERDRAEQARLIKEEGPGLAQLSTQTAIDRMMAREHDLGTNWAVRSGMSAAYGAMDFMGMDERTIRGAGPVRSPGSSETSGLSELLARGMAGVYDWATGAGTPTHGGNREVVAAIKEQTRLMQRDRNPTLGRPDEDR